MEKTFTLIVTVTADTKDISDSRLADIVLDAIADKVPHVLTAHVATPDGLTSVAL